MGARKEVALEDRMKAFTLEQYGTDDLSQFAPGHIEWIEKEVMSRGD